MLTLADVLSEIKRQLTIAQPNVVLSREQAEFLHARAIELLNELDGLRAVTEDMRLETLRRQETQKEPGPDQHLGPAFHIERDKG